MISFYSLILKVCVEGSLKMASSALLRRRLNLFWCQQAGRRGGGLRRHRGGGRSRCEQRAAGLLDLTVQSSGEFLPHARGAPYRGPRHRQLRNRRAEERGAAERYDGGAGLLR